MIGETRNSNRLLRYQREQRGWTQARLAEELYKRCEDNSRPSARGEINAKMIGAWERGEHVPSSYYQEKLRLLFGKSAEELGFIESLPQPGRAPVVVPSSVQQVLPALFTPHQAIDLLCEAPDESVEQQLGAWLALGAGDLAPLFASGWSLEDVLISLKLVLQGVQAMSKFPRRILFKLGAAAVISNIPIPEGKHISAEDLTKLHSALGESIAAGWNLFSIAGNAQVLAIGQAQLFLLKQNHSLLYPSVLPMFYSATYRLIGAALFFQQHYEEAHREHNCAYMAALESADGWNMAQSRIWQAYGYQVRGRHAEAIQFIEAALRLTMEPNDETHRRLRSHLLALWAENATMLKEYTTADVQEKLEASLALLDGIAPNEEFDRAHWHQKAGNCALAIKDYPAAIRHFKEAQEELLPHLTMRQAVTLIPLAVAHARIGERDASLTIAKRAVPLISTLKAPLLNRQFVEYIRGDLLRLFPNDARTFIADIRHQLPQITAVVGQESKRKE